MNFKNCDLYLNRCYRLSVAGTRWMLPVMVEDVGRHQPVWMVSAGLPAVGQLATRMEASSCL